MDDLNIIDISKSQDDACANTAGEVPLKKTVDQLDGKSEMMANTKKSRKSDFPCTVCGDKGRCVNFGAFTCDSCKAFFRRNITRAMVKGGMATCISNGNCIIDKKNRKRCPHCRITKCLQVGMHVQNSNCKTKTPYLSTIKSNPTKNEIQTSQATDTTSNCTRPNVMSLVPPTYNHSLTTNLSSSEGGLVAPVRQQLPINNLVHNFFSSFVSLQTYPAMHESFTGVWFGQGGLMNQCSHAGNQDYINDDSSYQCLTQRPNASFLSTHHTDTTDSIIIHLDNNAQPNQSDDELITLVTYTDSELPVLSVDTVCLELRLIKVEELLVANRVWNYGMSRASSINSDAEFSNFDYCKMVFNTFKNLIKQHAALSSFKVLTTQDRMDIMQSRSAVLAVIRAAMRYIPATSEMDMQFPKHHRLSTDLAKRLKGNNVHQQFITILQSYPAKCRSNETVGLIVSAIALFDADCLQLENKKMVENGRKEYIQLLMDYIESTYGPSDARYVSRYLLDWISFISSWVKECNKSAQDMRFQLNPNSLEMLSFQFTALK